MTDHGVSPQLRSIHRQIRFATLRVTAALMLREMGATYGKQPGGYLWTILEPVAGIALLTTIFTAVGFRHPALGTDFAMFYATGLLPFYTFNAIAGKLTGALGSSRSLLAYPRVTIVDVLAAKFALHLLTQLVVVCTVLTGIRLINDTGTQFLAERVVLGFAMAVTLGAGIGTMNCYLVKQFPVYANLWRIVTRPLMLVSGVMFLVERLPAEWQPWFLWNPLVHVVAEVRSGFYHGYDPTFISPVLVFVVALVAGALGLLFLWRYHRDVLED
jgi:capsular polysaccharide transport system permease protein